MLQNWSWRMCVTVGVVTVSFAGVSRPKADEPSGSKTSHSKGFPDAVFCDSFVTMISGWICSNALLKICVSLKTATGYLHY